MGALFRFETLVAPKSRVRDVLLEMVENEDSSRYFESDMYRGDFGDSSVRPNPSFEDDTKSSKKKESNTEKFAKEKFCEFEKYVIHYALVGTEGYIAYEQPRVSLEPNTRLKKDEIFTLKYKNDNPFFESPNNTAGRFENITSMKKYITNHYNVQSLVGASIYKYNKRLGTQSKVGNLVSKSRTYKNKPQTLPKKYVKLDKVVNVAYGGWCPY